jgi:quercetin dioxygenase-like cupin family protein
MKTVFNLNALGDIPSFSPPHHSGTIDRKLVHEETGSKHMAIWYGEIEPGGVADEHFHEEMEQAFYILDGECLFRVGDQEHRLGKGSLAFVPAKQPHKVVSVGEAPLKLLIIMAPPPEGMEAWKR